VTILSPSQFGQFAFALIFPREGGQRSRVSNGASGIPFPVNRFTHACNI